MVIKFFAMLGNIWLFNEYFGYVIENKSSVRRAKHYLPQSNLTFNLKINSNVGNKIILNNN